MRPSNHIIARDEEAVVVVVVALTVAALAAVWPRVLGWQKRLKQRRSPQGLRRPQGIDQSSIALYAWSSHSFVLSPELGQPMPLG